MGAISNLTPVDSFLLFQIIGAYWAIHAARVYQIWLFTVGEQSDYVFLLV